MLTYLKHAQTRFGCTKQLNLLVVLGLVGLGQSLSADGLGWIGSHKNGRVGNSAIDPIASWSPFLGSLINLAAITVERYLKV